MACHSPTTEYKFEFDHANIKGGTESTTGSDCPDWDSNLEAEAYFEAQRRFRAYLESKTENACGPGCRRFNESDWVPVPGMQNEVKLKRIFFKIECTDKEGNKHTCLYSFEVIFYYRVMKRTVECMPSLEGPNDFFMEPVQLEGDC